MTEQKHQPADDSQDQVIEQAAFLDNAGRRQLELLAHRLRFDDGLQLLIGEFGSGRSTLLKQLAELDPDSTLQIVLSGSDSPYPVHGTRALLQALGENSPEDADEAQLALTQHLQARSERGRQTVLAIDDADQLSVQQLEAWLQWWQETQSNAAGSLPLMLVGGEQLVPYAIDLLGQEQPDPAVTQLRPLDLQRARAFLEYSLGDSLQGGLLPFSNGELDELHRESGGLPGPLLDAAEQALLQAQNSTQPVWHQARERLAPVLGRFPEWVRDRRVQLGVALIAVALLLFAIEPDEPEAVGPVVKALPIQLPSTTAKPAEAPQQPAPEPATAVIPKPIPLPKPPAPETQAASQAPAAAAKPEELTEAPPRQPPPPPQPEPATIKLLSELAPPMGLSAAPASKPNPKKPPEAPEAPEETVKEEPAAEPAAKPSPAEPAPPKPEASKPEKQSSPTGDHEWFLLQPGERYTLQLLATGQRGALDNFAKQHKLLGELRTFSIVRNGKRLHILVLGSFPNRTEASAELARLPTEVRRQKPWIRSIASVQKAIREQGR